MQSVRLKFTKQGEGRFISHLDMNRMFARSFKRAGIPIWYTEGFNKHPHVVFSAPLSVGTTSVCELADFRVVEDVSFDEIMKRVNQNFPRDFKAVAVYEPKTKLSDIAFSVYEFVFAGESAKENIANLFSGDAPLEVVRKTKRSQSTINLKELVKDITLTAKDGATKMTCTLPSSNEGTVKPSLLLSVIDAPCISAQRIKFLDQSGEEFN